MIERDCDPQKKAALIITPSDKRKTKEERDEQSRLFHVQLKKLTCPTIKEYQDELNRRLKLQLKGLLYPERIMQTSIAEMANPPYALKEAAWEKHRCIAFSDPLEKLSTFKMTAAAAYASSSAGVIEQFSLNSIEDMEKRLFPINEYLPKANSREAREDAKRERDEQQFRESQKRMQFIIDQPKRHKEMLIEAQVEALRRFEAEMQVKAAQPQAEIIGDVLAGSQDAVLAVHVNSNCSEFSGLLNVPQKTDAWFWAIDDMTRAFHSQYGKIPNEFQAWAQLSSSPPPGYEIKPGTDKGEDCLNMPGEKPLGRGAFSKRWKSYNADKPQ